MSNRFEGRSGLVVEIVSSTLTAVCADSVGRTPQRPPLLVCRVPRALMASAEQRVETMFATVVCDDVEVAFLLLRGGGALAAVAFDITGEHAQAWMHVGTARGRLYLAMSDGHSTKAVRIDVLPEMRDALSRSVRRRPANAEYMAAALTTVCEWLDGAELVRQHSGVGAEISEAVLSMYVELSVAERHAAARRGL